MQNENHGILKWQLEIRAELEAQHRRLSLLVTSDALFFQLVVDANRALCKLCFFFGIIYDL